MATHNNCNGEIGFLHAHFAKVEAEWGELALLKQEWQDRVIALMADPNTAHGTIDVLEEDNDAP